MTLTARLTPSKPVHPRTPARRNSFRALRAETARLMAFARENSRRFQSQWVILFAVGVLALAMIAGLYLNVTASAAIAGREIQNIEAEITINERVNADLQTRIATLLSNQVLEERALDMGFAPVSIETLDYMPVPGYFPAQAVTLVQPETQADLLRESPGFNETLIDWFEKQMEVASIPLIQVKH